MPSLLATIGLNVSPFKAGLEEAKSDAHHAGGNIKEAFGEAIGEKLGQVASMAFLEETVRRTVEYADRIDELSDRLGISTEAVQRWDYALQLNGSSIQAATSFFEKLAVARQKALQGSDKEVGAFNRLGVSMDELKSKRLEDIGEQISRAFEAGDPQALIADLRAVGGKAAGELATAFKAGLSEEMGKAPVIPDSDIAKLAELADEAKAIWLTFIASVAPAIATIADIVKTTLFGIGTTLVATGESLATFFRTMKDLTLSPMDLINPAKLIQNITAATSAAGQKFGETFQDAFAGEGNRMLDAEEARAKRKGVGRDIAGLDEIENKKEKEKEKNLQEEILKLKEKAAEITAQTALKEMTAAERVMALQEGLRRAKESLLYLQSDKQRAQTEVDIAELERELSVAEKAKKTEDERELKKDQKSDRYRAPEVNALQRIGAYVSTGDDTRNIAQRSEQHLQAVKEGISELVKNSKDARF